MLQLKNRNIWNKTVNTARVHFPLRKLCLTSSYCVKYSGSESEHFETCFPISNSGAAPHVF